MAVESFRLSFGGYGQEIVSQSTFVNAQFDSIDIIVEIPLVHIYPIWI